MPRETIYLTRNSTTERGLRVYFPGLNHIRYIAAFAVIVHHVEQFKKLTGHHTIFNTYIMQTLGGKAVQAFFVLSGFLITYLLFREQSATQTINIRHFYIRRVLRIWPLYYLTTAIAFFVVPHIVRFSNAPELEETRASFFQHYWPELGLFLAFVPNLCLWIYGPVLCAAQAWSIGVEEQFYLVWPWLIRRFNRRPLFLMLLTIGLKQAAVALSLWIVAMPLIATSVETARRIGIALEFLTGLLPETMAIGGIAAYFYHRHEMKARKWLGNRIAGAIVSAMVVIVIAIAVPFSRFTIPIAFALAILCLALKPQKPGFFDRTATYLADISYGMYMFHPLAICLTLMMLSKLSHGSPARDGVIFEVLLYSLAVVVTIGLSSASYYWFEKPFLRLKEGLATIRTSHAT